MQPKVLSHRALGFGYRENTLKAFKEAMNSDVEEIELDFRLTKDNVYVCNHDPELAISKTKKLLLRKYNFDQINQKRKRIASLKDILEYFTANKQNKRLNIDIKDYGNEEEIIRLIKRYKIKDNVVLISWIPKVLEKIRRLDNEVRISFSYIPAKKHLLKILKLIQAKLQMKKTRRHIFINKINLNQFNPRYAKGYNHIHLFYQLPAPILKLKLDSINIPWFLVNKNVVREAHRNNIKVRVFSVDSKKRFEKMKKQKIDTVFSNEVYEL